MSIADQITRLQTAKANIKSAIEQKGVTVGDGTIDTYAEKISEISSGGSGDYDQGYEDGKNSVVQIERYVTQLRLKSLNIFGKSEAVLNLDNVTTLADFCSVNSELNKNIIVEHLTINCPNLISGMGNAFYVTGTTDVTLKKLTLNLNTKNCNSFLRAFANLTALEIIDGTPLDFSSATSATAINAFVNVRQLKELRFAEQSILFNFGLPSCQYLSDDTIQSIIDGLADLTGGTAQTLTVHADVGAKLTDEQKANITAKNWTLVY